MKHTTPMISALAPTGLRVDALVLDPALTTVDGKGTATVVGVTAAPGTAGATALTVYDTDSSRCAGQSTG